MPIYEYRCRNGHKFEEWHRIESRHNVVCPTCRESAQIQISLCSFRMDTPVTFLTHDGKIIDRKPSGKNAPIGRPDGANITMV